MAMMSKDADERYQQKKEREKKASKWMREAEKSTIREDYESALYQYTKVSECSWSCPFGF